MIPLAKPDRKPVSKGVGTQPAGHRAKQDLDLGRGREADGK